LQCALKECWDNRRPMEHSRRFGRALMSSIQRTRIAEGVSLRGIRGAPATPEALRNGQRSCPGRIGAPRFATCLPSTRRRYSRRPSNLPHAMHRIRSRRDCRAGSCTRSIHGWCHVADDAGVARATDRSSAQRDIDRGSRAAAGRRHQLQPRDASASLMLRRCRRRRANAIAPSRQDTSNGSGPRGDVRRCHPHDPALRLR
jgi:hypothetical protein